MVELELPDLPGRRLAPGGLLLEVCVGLRRQASEALGILPGAIVDLRGIAGRVVELLDDAPLLLHPHIAQRPIRNRHRRQRVEGARPVLVEVRNPGLAALRQGLAPGAGQDLGHAGTAVAAGQREPQQVQDRRPHVDIAAAGVDDEPGLEAEREGDHQRRLGRLPVDLARVPLEAALAEGLPVVRDQDDERVVEVAEVFEMAEEELQHAIGPADRVVVDVRVLDAEEGGLLIVEVLVDVHPVQVQEPALLAPHPQELHGGGDRSLVGAGPRDRGVLAPGARRQRSLDGPLVHLEALVESKGRGDPAVAVEADGLESVVPQDLCRHQRLRREDLVEARDAGSRGIETRPERRHRRLRPGRLGEVAGKAHPGPGQAVESRAGLALVAVAAQALGPQGVDHDEEHVQIVPILERLDVLDGSDRASIPVAGVADLDHGGEEDQHDRTGSCEPGPTSVQQTLRHGAEASAATPVRWTSIIPR